MQNTEFVALAEFENKDILALGYLQTDFGIYYIDVVDDTASPLGVEFLPALKEFIATASAR